MNPQNTDPAGQFYRGETGRHYHEEKRGLPSEALPWVISLRSEKFCAHVKSTDVVLEFGVGSGWNLAGLKCARKMGFDIADSVAEKLGKLQIEFVKDMQSVPDQTIDVAICHQTLEHLTRPFEALLDLRRILKTTGRLILHVPWEHERRYRYYDASEPNHHLYNWNAQNIGNLVSVAGFKIESLRVVSYGYDRFAAVIAHRLHLGEKSFRIFRRGLISLKPLREVELIAAL
jgi:SAM-dependent methyltransferase